MDLLELKKKVALFYLLRFKTLTKTAGRKSFSDLGVSDMKLDNTGRLAEPVALNKRRRRMGEYCKSYVRSQCLKCGVELCISCFLPYHTK